MSAYPFCPANHPTSDGPTLAGLIDRLREHAGRQQADVASAIRNALAEVDPDPRVVRADVTEHTVSYVVKLGPPLPLVVSGKTEDVWPGLAMRSSSLENAPLALSLALTRATCLNTIHAPCRDCRVVHSGHRGLDLDRLRVRIVMGLHDSDERLREGVRVMGAASQDWVANAGVEVRRLLRRARLPVGQLGDVAAALDKDPRQSKFAVAQAIAWAAQRTDPDTRWALERIAGTYLARS